MTASAALLCLAMAVYHESRGEPLIGQVAVAHVVLNRTQSDLYPDDVCAVVTQPRQFPFDWNAPRNTRAWEQSVMVAESVLSGDTFDPTGGALWYHRIDIRVAWSSDKEGLTIGEHIFWRQ